MSEQTDKVLDVPEHIDPGTCPEPGSAPCADAGVRCGGAPASRADADPGIAFLYADETLAAHVREALDAQSARIVYQSRFTDMDAGALAASGVAVALVNLDGAADERLGALTALFDDSGVPVVFNDAEISRGLDGWARARWARHLLAKLRGSDDVDPPRPAQPAIAETTIRASSNGNGGAHEPVAEHATQEPATPEAEGDPASIASRPLSDGEIESLLADFPSEAEIGARETVDFSAHVDALLAETVQKAATQPVDWEIAAALEADRTEAEAEATAAKAAPLSLAPVSSGSGEWRLVDEPAVVHPAPREAAAADSARPSTFGADFELVPLETVISAVAREREFDEMRLEGEAARRPGGEG